MNGKVSGLPTTVPIAEASMLPPMAKAMMKPITRCSPMNGVKAERMPAATPAATACGEPDSLRTRLPK
jgi:hypothetical protein